MKRGNSLSCLVVLKMDVTETGFENVHYTQMLQDTNHCLVLLNSKMKLVKLRKESLDQLNIHHILWNISALWNWRILSIYLEMRRLPRSRGQCSLHSKHLHIITLNLIPKIGQFIKVCRQIVTTLQQFRLHVALVTSKMKFHFLNFYIKLK